MWYNCFWFRQSNDGFEDRKMKILENRLIILAGHYGSGKTNIALTLAVLAKERGERVTVVDLDIINPYFRLADGEKVLEENGIPIICPAFSNTNVDIPSLRPELDGLFSSDKNGCVIVDVGGDEAGAIALGRYSQIIAKRSYALLLVANKYRPFTFTTSGTVEIMEQIESAGRLKFTGIAANPSLGRETTADAVTATLPYYRELSEKTNLPVVFTAVREDLYGLCSGKIDGDIIPIKIFSKPGWEIY